MGLEETLRSPEDTRTCTLSPSLVILRGENNNQHLQGPRGRDCSQGSYSNEKKGTHREGVTGVDLFLFFFFLEHRG